jgi:hypothetical protein
LPQRAAIALPAASPAMKLPSTMLEAHTLLPSVSPIVRNHTVSNRTPAAPESRRIAHSTSAMRGTIARAEAATFPLIDGDARPDLAALLGHQAVALDRHAAVGAQGAARAIEVLAVRRIVHQVNPEPGGDGREPRIRSGLVISRRAKVHDAPHFWRQHWQVPLAGPGTALATTGAYRR